MVNQNIRKKVFEADCNRCIVCGFSGKSLDKKPILEAAHIIPDNEGGPESLGNLISLCVRCHRLFDDYNLFYFDPETRRMILHESCDAERLDIFEKEGIFCPDRIEKGYLTRRKQLVCGYWID